MPAQRQAGRKPASKTSAVRKAPTRKLAQPSPAAQLQRRLGNAGTQAFLQSISASSPGNVAAAKVQTKLSVGRPNDAYEREADAAAERVVAGKPVEGLSSLASGDLTPSGSSQKEPSARQIRTRINSSEADPSADSLHDELYGENGVRESLTPPQASPPNENLATEGKREDPEIFGSEPTQPIQRMCENCVSELQQKTTFEITTSDREKPTPDLPLIRTKADENQPRTELDFEERLSSSKGNGKSLPQDTRSSFEASFGADFQNVKIHTGSEAAGMNKSLGAQAFAHSSDIYFSQGKFDPQSTSGRRLLAHELTHTVQQGASAPLAKKPSDDQGTRPVAGDTPDIQAAWYNFDIPFTDYQFDPSIEGVKNAANIAKDTVVDTAGRVKDKASDAFMWIYRRIEKLVSKGVSWLKGKWSDLENFAKRGLEGAQSFFDGISTFLMGPLGFLPSAFLNMDAESIRNTWGSFTTFVLNIWASFEKVGKGLLSTVGSLWTAIDSRVSGFFNDINSLTSHWAFRKLPSAIQNAALQLVKTLRSLWTSVKKGWNAIFGKIKKFVDDSFRAVRTFVENILSFAIDKIIIAVLQFGKLIFFLKDLLTNPKKHLKPLSEKINGYLKGVEDQFRPQVDTYFSTGNKVVDTESTGKAGTGSEVVQRKEDSSTERDSATWSEIGDGVWGIMKKKWEAVKKDPLSIVFNILLDMVLPVVGNVKDIVKLFQDIKQIVFKPLKASSLKELWTSFLHLLDIPILIYNTFWSIVGRTLMVPLIIASFVPHPLVKGIAIAAGYALLGALIAGELANIGQKLLLLRSGNTTKKEKKDAYNRLGDSLIALALEAALAIFMLVVAAVANVAKGVFGFVRGKVFSPKTQVKKTVEVETGGGKKVELPEPGKKDLAPETSRPTVDKTKNKAGKDLTPEEIKAEFDSFKDGKLQRSSDPKYDWEIELPNGHKWKRKKNGKWCRFTTQHCFKEELPFQSDKELYEYLKKEGLVTESFDSFEKAGKDFEKALAKESTTRPTRTKEEILPNGKVPENRKDAFSKWFDDLSDAELDILLKDDKIREKIAARIRSPGKLHEWGMVAEAAKLKKLGVSMFEIKRLRVKTAELKWTHPSKGEKGGHGGTGSGDFHIELRKVIDGAKTITELNKGLAELRDRWKIDPSHLPLPIKEMR